jgi:hypothetical protein
MTAFATKDRERIFEITVFIRAQVRAMGRSISESPPVELDVQGPGWAT